MSVLLCRPLCKLSGKDLSPPGSVTTIPSEENGLGLCGVVWYGGVQVQELKMTALSFSKGAFNKSLARDGMSHTKLNTHITTEASCVLKRMKDSGGV